MKSPRLLSIEAIEDRVVPAAVSISYVGSALVVQTAESDVRATQKAPAQTVARADVFRVTNDDGTSQFLVRVPSWRGGWNNYLSQSVVSSSQSQSSSQQPTQYASSAATSSASGVPFSPSFLSSRGQSTGRTQTGGSSAANTEPSVQQISALASVGGSAATNAGNAVSSSSGNTSAISTPIQKPTAGEGNASNAPKPLPLVGSMNEAILPENAEAGSTPAEAAPVPQSQSAEPPMILASDVPIIVTQLAQSLPFAGMMPFNIREVESGVRGVLDRVAEFEENWVEEASGAEDYLWAAAGGLIAGGVMQAAWSRRNQFTDRRVLGMDSVLARWGSNHDGGRKG